VKEDLAQVSSALVDLVRSEDAANLMEALAGVPPESRMHLLWNGGKGDCLLTALAKVVVELDQAAEKGATDECQNLIRVGSALAQLLASEFSSPHPPRWLGGDGGGGGSLVCTRAAAEAAVAVTARLLDLPDEETLAGLGETRSACALCLRHFFNVSQDVVSLLERDSQRVFIWVSRELMRRVESERAEENAAEQSTSSMRLRDDQVTALSEITADYEEM